MLAQVKSRVVGTPYVWKNVVWSFLKKTKHDKALPSHNNGKKWLLSTHFFRIFFSIFLGYSICQSKDTVAQKMWMKYLLSQVYFVDAGTEMSSATIASARETMST